MITLLLISDNGDNLTQGIQTSKNKYTHPGITLDDPLEGAFACTFRVGLSVLHFLTSGRPAPALEPPAEWLG